MQGRGEPCEEPDPAGPAVPPSGRRQGSRGRGARYPDRPRSVITRRFAALSDQPLSNQVSPSRSATRTGRRASSLSFSHSFEAQDSSGEDEFGGVAPNPPSTEYLDWAPDWDFPVYQESDLSGDSEVSVSEVFTEDREASTAELPTPLAPANSPVKPVNSNRRLSYDLRRRPDPSDVLKRSIKRVLDRKKRLSRARRFREDWPPENPNRPPILSTNTMVEIDKHKQAAALAVMKYDDDFKDFDMEVEAPELREALSEATKAKGQLQEAMVYLMIHDSDNYRNDYEAGMQDAKVGLLRIIKRMQTRLKEIAAADSMTANAGAELAAQQNRLKSERVDRLCNPVCESISLREFQCHS